jgi:hypothetical protein
MLAVQLVDIVLEVLAAGSQERRHDENSQPKRNVMYLFHRDNHFIYWSIGVNEVV